MASIPIYQMEVTGPMLQRHLETRGTISAVMLTSGDVDSELGSRAMPTSAGYTTWLLGIHNEGDGVPFRRCPRPRQHSHPKSADASEHTGDTPGTP